MQRHHTVKTLYKTFIQPKLVYYMNLTGIVKKFKQVFNILNSNVQFFEHCLFKILNTCLNF